MPSEVILPRVDMDMATGKISKWFVESGATVVKGQPLFEIETDKAAMEIEAPASGTIRDLAVASAGDIPVGSVVAWIYRDGEGSAAPSTAPNPVVEAGSGQADDQASHPPSLEIFGEARPPTLSLASAAEPSRPRATPMARRLAREHGVDLAALRGTGPRGRIQARDIVAGPAAVSPVMSTPAGTMGQAAAVLDAAGPGQVPATSPISAFRPRPAAAPASSGPLNLVQLREGQGAPVLLIHGFGAEADTWRPFLSGRPASQPVYALDLPGHGVSSVGPVTSFETLVDSVEAALLQAGFPAFDLVGHSLGGGVATALAGRGSLDIRSLLLLSPAGLGPDINGDFIRGFLGATSEAALTPWMNELVVDASVITPSFVRATLRARKETSLLATQRHIAEAVFPDGTQAFSIRADLAKLAMPVRIVFGTADRMIPAKHVTGLPGIVALHLFPNVGHLPQFEVRDAVAAIMAQMKQ